MAEAIALAFVAPLLALYMAAIFLGERIGRRSVAASLLGFMGVLVIVAGKLGGSDRDPEALWAVGAVRSEEHTSELQSLMRISYAVFCLKKKIIRVSTAVHLPFNRQNN